MNIKYFYIFLVLCIMLEENVNICIEIVSLRRKKRSLKHFCNTNSVDMPYLVCDNGFCTI